MIIGIGIDLLSNNRLKKIIKKFDEKFLARIYTAFEIAEFNKLKARNQKNSAKALNFLAKRFASKEAFAKALGVGIGQHINFHDIEIYNDLLGKPHIRIINNKEVKIKKLLQCQKFNIHLTITDEKTICGATVVIEKI